MKQRMKHVKKGEMGRKMACWASTCGLDKHVYGHFLHTRHTMLHIYNVEGSLPEWLEVAGTRDVYPGTLRSVRAKVPDMPWSPLAKD